MVSLSLIKLTNALSQPQPETPNAYIMQVGMGHIEGQKSLGDALLMLPGSATDHTYMKEIHISRRTAQLPIFDRR